jgi:hypothetical protein
MASITGDTLQEQIQKAISAHGVYKFRLVHMVEAQTNEIPPATAASDSYCAIGQWLSESLAPQARASRHYRNVVDLHTRFHRAAGEIASLSAARRRTEALEAMEPTSSFKRLSDQLVEALEAWAAAEETGETPAAEVPAGGGQEAAEAAEAVETPATEPEWWSPTSGPTAEADEAAEGATQDETAEGGGRPATSRSDVEGTDGIDAWFGLPRNPPRGGWPGADQQEADQQAAEPGAEEE